MRETREANRILDTIAHAKRVTGAELARRTGISQASISRILRGEQELTVAAAWAIAEALDIPPTVVFENFAEAIAKYANTPLDLRISRSGCDGITAELAQAA